MKGENNEPCTNHTVYAFAENKKVSINESTETNENGKGKGKDVITFSTQENNAGITNKVSVVIK